MLGELGLESTVEKHKRADAFCHIRWKQWRRFELADENRFLALSDEGDGETERSDGYCE